MCTWRNRAFTLLELMIVLTIIAIVTTLLMPVYAYLEERAEKVQCTANLRGLYSATDLYVQREGHWPQIFLKSYATGEEYANAWITALAPFGVERKHWICPTIQNLLRNPDYSQPERARIDYVSTGFDARPTSPHQWPRQPWFIETGDVHGNGNLVIFTDGSLGQTNDLVKR